MTTQNDDELPDIYSDQCIITVGVFGISMTFGLNEPHPAQGGVPRAAVEKARVRMSLQHAKVIAMMLRRNLKRYEEQTATDIQIPQDVYAGLGIAAEDWR